MRFCVDPPRVSAVGGSQTGGLTLKTSDNPEFAKSSQSPLVWDNSPAMSVGSVYGSQRTNAIYHLFLVQTRRGMHTNQRFRELYPHQAVFCRSNSGMCCGATG